MGLRIGPAKLHAVELHKEAVADIIGIFRLVGVGGRHNAELHHLGIGTVVQAEEVGAGLLQRGGIFAHRRGGNAGKKLAAAMAEAFVEIGVDLIRDGAVLPIKGLFLIAVGEFVEDILGAFAGGEIVGVGNVGNGHRLGAVLLADPVGVGKVDANRGGGVAVPREGNGVDDLGGNSLDLCLPESRIHRGMILEPLRVGAQRLGAGRCHGILEVHVAFPGTLPPERIVVVFDESVDEIHLPEGILHPFNIEGIPGAEIAGAVIFHQQAEGPGLDLILGDSLGFLQLLADLLDGRSIDAADLPGQLHNLALFLDNLGIEAIRNGMRVLRLHNPGIIALHLGAGDAVVEIDGRELDNVAGSLGRTPLRIDGGVVDDVQQALIRLPDRLHQRGEIFASAFREELILGIVVMNAVGEEQPFGIIGEPEEFLAFPVALIPHENRLYGMADGQIILAVLVPENVAAILRRFGKMVGILLLLQRQFLPSGHGKPHHPQIGELVNQILEPGISFPGLLLRAGDRCKRQTHHQQ